MIFAVVTIALMVVFSIIVALPALFGSGQSSGSDQLAFTPAAQVTPGSQEAEMRARLQKNPNDYNAMLVLAGLLANSGQSDEAIQWYDKAVQLKPNDAAVRIAFGQTLLQSQYYLDAEIQLQKAASLAPNNPEPPYLLGQLYQNENPPQKDKAKAMYQKVEKIAPTSTYAQQAKNQLATLNKGS